MTAAGQMLLALDVHCVDCFAHAGLWEIAAPYFAGIGAITAAMIAYQGIIKQIRSTAESQERVFAEERTRARADADRRKAAVMLRLNALNINAFLQLSSLLQEPLYDFDSVAGALHDLYVEIMNPEIAEVLASLELGNLFGRATVLDFAGRSLRSYQAARGTPEYGDDRLSNLSIKTSKLALESVHKIATILGDKATMKQIETLLPEEFLAGNEPSRDSQVAGR